jgi:hypothetical protein
VLRILPEQAQLPGTHPIPNKKNDIFWFRFGFVLAL